LLEASYDVGAPTMEAWLAAVLTQVARLLEPDVAIGMLVGSYTPSTFDIMNMATNGPASLRDWFDGVHRQAPPEFVNLVYKSGSALLSASRDTWPKFPALRAEAARLSEGRIQDVISVAGHTGLGHVVTVAALCPKLTSVTALERVRWPRAIAHIAAGLRLYLSFERALESPRVEAVLDPAGHTRDAKPVAQSQRKRQLLREAVRRIDGARTSAGRKDVTSSLRAWQGLIEGRWSLVDHFDSDGKRFILAVKNDPEHPDPRGLTAQERQVATFLGLGQSTKSIAYTLGIAEAAVSAHVSRAKHKVGLRSRAELATFFEPAGVRARLAEAVIGGERVLVGTYPPSNADAAAQLTPTERDVVAHLMCGSTNQDIAIRRGTSSRTIANQIQSIFRKLGVQSRVELALRLQSSH
jgi:DNA-binding NarL/FixJ family response regulator